MSWKKKVGMRHSTFGTAANVRAQTLPAPKTVYFAILKLLSIENLSGDDESTIKSRLSLKSSCALIKFRDFFDSKLFFRI